MANEEHVAILKQGVNVWNEWREKNRKTKTGVMPDLSGANLNRADLNHAYFVGTKLRGANLAGANLSEANLFLAFLDGANLNGADISGVNLTKAHLFQTLFSGTKLNGANFHLTRFGGTHFADLDLTDATGLDSIVHYARSFLDIETLKRSKGKIPEVFLRGIGWSDAEIEFILPLYRDNVIQYYSGFISYSSKDDEFTQRLYNDLQGAGVRVWKASEDLKIGDEFAKKINQEIRLRDKLILVLSEDSVNSDWVAFEVDKALREEKERNTGKGDDEPVDPVLFPIAIDDAVFDSDEQWAWAIRKNRHIGDLRGWKDHDTYQAGLARLLRDLKGGK